MRLFRHHGSAALLISESGGEGPTPIGGPGLTPRESDVLWLVANGRTSAQAAQVLRISVRTVEKHLGNIYAKLGVSNRTEASLRVFGASTGHARPDLTPAG
ncbi:response regulator transcription factor [Streptosporangium lutulentum]